MVSLVYQSKLAGRMVFFVDLVRIARDDEGLDWKTFDVDRDVPLLDQEAGTVDAVNPDLSKFKARGGKLLMYHGWADPAISPQNTIRYLRVRTQDDGVAAG